MAIPLPNPNINDFDTNDVQTWSSNKLKEGFEAVGGSVGSDGSVAPVQAELIYNAVLESAETNIEINDISVKHIVVISEITFDATTTNGFYLYVKTAEKNDAFFQSSAYASRSYTGGTKMINRLVCDCEGNLLKGSAVSSPIAYFSNATAYFDQDYLDNIICSKITALKIVSSTAMPVGSKIKIYAW